MSHSQAPPTNVAEAHERFELALVSMLAFAAESEDYLLGTPDEAEGLGWALVRVVEEYARATQRYDSFQSVHEGLGVLLEEWTELVEAVRSNDPVAIMREAEQVAAMAVRFMVDVADLYRLAGEMRRDDVP